MEAAVLRLIYTVEKARGEVLGLTLANSWRREVFRHLAKRLFFLYLFATAGAGLASSRRYKLDAVVNGFFPRAKN